MRLLPLLFASVAAAEMSYTVTATQGGKRIDASHLTLEAIPWKSWTHSRWSSTTNSTSSSSPGAHKSHRSSSGSSEIDKRAPISYSSGWCGISKRGPSNDPIKTVVGSFTAPNLRDRTGTYPQFGAAWVGIDGASCQSTLVQAGVTTILNSNGGQSASAWFEWVPNASYTIPKFPVKAGDWLMVNVTALTKNSAQISITNYDRDYAMTVTVTGGTTLCQADADWIVEDFTSGGKPVPFARFDDIWFEDARATTASGGTFGLDNAAMIYLGNSESSAMCIAQPYDDSNFWCSSQN
ncbi:concanavalin A-like lectin/glucanase domain-containing protein [Coniochaeta sp. 2T2.1]|nr:concanavalin A-like lectin/glucanase domain-containing protein [Coniochaeta sp. 2T2.1]